MIVELSKRYLCALAVTALSCGAAQAQIAASNPLEWVALEEGHELIYGTVKKEMEGQRKTAVLQNTIAAEFNQMHHWQKKYNSYLTTVDGYASSLKAATHLYNDGVKILLTLNSIRKAIANNPQGVVATVSMNNLYMETATELITVYNMLNDAVAKGGKENMLTGADRSKTLWALNDQLSSFQKKLNQLYMSIRYYTMMDVWNNASAGILDRTNGEVARQALDRWRRCSRVTMP